MNAGPMLQKLCSAAEVTADMPVRCEVDGTAYAVFRIEDGFFVLDDQCSHGPGSLSDGYVEGCEVECPFHQGRFDIRTGRAVGPPCSEPVRAWKARVIDDFVAIDLTQEQEA